MLGMSNISHRDLYREVYSVLGMPIDRLDLTIACDRVETAAASEAPFLLSTPNLNFLASFDTDAELRESLLQSDLCTADGAPIVWLARLLGINLPERVAGSDLFDALRDTRRERPLRVFFFGGAEGVAEAAAARLAGSGLEVVGTHCPGFGSVEGMSGEEILAKINGSGAQLLIASLGAAKGQSWLMRNHGKLKVPVRVHLGAVINFQAGRVTRAPHVIRQLSLEWLWRIKEEPHLWRRYAKDAAVLLRYTFTRVLPLAGLRIRHRRTAGEGELNVETISAEDKITLKLRGVGTAATANTARAMFSSALDQRKDIRLDLGQLRYLDARFIGLLLMLRKECCSRDLKLRIENPSVTTAKILRLHGRNYSAMR